MRTMFPEMDAEIASDRLAEKREAVQRARDYLKVMGGYERWILKRLEQGPAVDANMMLEAAEMSDIPATAMNAAMNMVTVAYAMWRVGKIARKPFPNHPCNEPCFLYSLK